MSQISFYKYATWGLLLLNLGMLAFFFLTKPKHPHQPTPNAFQNEVIERLRLNAQQERTFRTLAAEHGQQMVSINEQQQQLLLPYFESLAAPANQMDKDSLLSRYQELERAKLEFTYQHFEEIESMLDENQLVYFEGIVHKFIDRIVLKSEKNIRPPAGI